MGDRTEWADVGERVRECRIAADLSQEQLAAVLNLDRTMIAKIERGIRRIDAIRAIAAADGASLRREDLVVLAARYRTSWTLTIRQAVAAGAVDKVTAREMRQRNPTKVELMEAVGWAPQPDLERVRVPPSYAHAVVEAYKKALITTPRAVELMRGQLVAADLPVRDEAELEP
ncbi:helix-turn-helix domain-containing protein [Nonomuraea fuscirosea]|uniref:helix-turn-helix domain-containing protein n=1 Tax=Nonomuraea fuscirosea TaxID=1291556 RepID=UPI0033DC8C6B